MCSHLSVRGLQKNTDAPVSCVSCSNPGLRKGPGAAGGLVGGITGADKPSASRSLSAHFNFRNGHSEPCFGNHLGLICEAVHQRKKGGELGCNERRGFQKHPALGCFTGPLGVPARERRC